MMMGTQKKIASNQMLVTEEDVDDDLRLFLFFGRSHAVVFDNPVCLTKNDSM